jgi:transcriptional regulator
MNARYGLGASIGLSRPCGAGPEQNREERLDVQHDLIDTHPFGLLISHDSAGFQANGLPFLLQGEAGPFGRLQAHIARSNPQWR